MPPVRLLVTAGSTPVTTAAATFAVVWHQIAQLQAFENMCYVPSCYDLEASRSAAIYSSIGLSCRPARPPIIAQRDPQTTLQRRNSKGVDWWGDVWGETAGQSSGQLRVLRREVRTVTFLSTRWYERGPSFDFISGRFPVLCKDADRVAAATKLG